jgi:hypothetical protein
MATPTRTTTWADGNVLTAAALNGEFNNLLNSMSIVNADISAGAAIAMSKIATGLSSGVVGLTDAQTITSKRITRRVYTQADGTTIDVNSDSYDEVKQLNTQITGTLTIDAPTGTPTDGQGLIYKIKCANSQTYSFNGIFKGGVVSLPTAHAGSSKYDYLGFLWNADSSTWDIVAYQAAVG